jgi:hypothetical protein
MLKNLKAWDKKEKVLCDVKVITNEGCFLVGNSPSKAIRAKIGKEEYTYGYIEEGHFVKHKDLELYQKFEI